MTTRTPVRRLIDRLAIAPRWERAKAFCHAARLGAEQMPDVACVLVGAPALLDAAGVAIGLGVVPMDAITRTWISAGATGLGLWLGYKSLQMLADLGRGDGGGWDKPAPKPVAPPPSSGGSKPDVYKMFNLERPSASAKPREPV